MGKIWENYGRLWENYGKIIGNYVDYGKISFR